MSLPNVIILYVYQKKHFLNFIHLICIVLKYHVFLSTNEICYIGLQLIILMR